MNDKIINIENCDVFQQNSQMVLHQINFELYAGDFCFLIGKTGSGKSSFLKALYAGLPIEGKQATVVNFDLLKMKSKHIYELRRKLGIVFQDFQLLSDRNVFDNLDFVLKATGWKNTLERKNRIIEVLEWVSLSTKLHKRTFELSGGEQQRVSIARALLNNPQIILADEPTGNLDPAVTDDIMALLYSISQKGTAVIMATHDYRLLDKDKGKVYKCEGAKIQLA